MNSTQAHIGKVCRAAVLLGLLPVMPLTAAHFDHLRDLRKHEAA